MTIEEENQKNFDARITIALIKKINRYYDGPTKKLLLWPRWYLLDHSPSEEEYEHIIDEIVESLLDEIIGYSLEVFRIESKTIISWRTFEPYLIFYAHVKETDRIRNQTVDYYQS